MVILRNIDKITRKFIIQPQSHFLVGKNLSPYSSFVALGESSRSNSYWALISTFCLEILVSVRK